ncbi:MAG: periplasmic heavy metal sensor [Ectothiorhodospiraceae bacterium]|nr:periplasmic heavy metal sensor [Ectothiorhodospiraceae bacterium]
MSKRLMVSGLILGLTLAGAAAAAGPRDGHRHHERQMEHMAERLELSSDQREQVQAAMQAHGPELQELHRQIREQRRALREQSADFNETAARSAADNLGALTAEAAFIATRMRADIQSVLTEEQRQAMAEHRQERKQRWHRHGGQRGERGELPGHDHRS